MRIALVHIRQATTGGVERYQNYLARFLAERGHEVSIVCRRHAEAPHPDVRFVKLHGFALGKTWRIWTFARDVERHVAGAGYDVVYGLGRTWTQDALRLGAGLHATYLELAHEAKLSTLERLTGGGMTRHKLVLHIERRALADPGCRRIVANSHMIRRDLERLYPAAADRVRVIHNGVDTERFHPRRRKAEGARTRRELGLEKSLVVLFLGTGFGRKGLDLLLDAFPALVRERPDARLLVVGADSAPGRFEARAERNGIAHAVRFLGGRPDPESWYASADVFALPTRYDPFANATVEALASGMPVITSARNGGAEVITQRVDGSVVDVSSSIEGLEEELLHWSTRETLEAGARAARATAETHAIEGKMEATERLLIELAGETRGP